MAIEYKEMITILLFALLIAGDITARIIKYKSEEQNEHTTRYME